MAYSKFQLQNLVINTANRYGLNPEYALLQVDNESKWKVDAYNRSSGAAGLFQFLVGTGRDYGLSPQDRYNPEKAVIAWAKYMTYLLKLFNYDYKLALAGYNWGQGNVLKLIKKTGSKDWNVLRSRVPRETRNYVDFITGGQNILPITVSNLLPNISSSSNLIFLGGSLGFFVLIAALLKK